MQWLVIVRRLNRKGYVHGDILPGLKLITQVGHMSRSGMGKVLINDVMALMD